MNTKFAPAERDSFETVQKQRSSLSSFSLMFDVLNVVPNGLLILNRRRQIVYANDAFQKISVLNGNDWVVGLRPGEALHCIHAFKMAGGCGTTELCVNCGAVEAILQAQESGASVQECRITRMGPDETEEALDLRVWATPFQFNEESYTVFAINDISHEKRRRVLERVIFHDMMNTADTIKGLAELAAIADDPEDLQEIDFGGLLDQASAQLTDEIDAQRQLLAAESGELVIEKKTEHTVPFLRGIVNLYERHIVAEGRQLKLDGATQDLQLATDYTLLQRVIGNMVKNALEACQPGETVTVSCDRYDDYARFWVHNAAYMPRDVQLQVFQRSFSTKGSGRGLGTYSMKLLSERYLDGRVSFQSS
ncbi:MAG: HAMP domain-containing histidine kinase, partial [Chloroflexi bacterium]|nr:HAMP domain-containing histidine kinase [Chloroflexota bacterium]